MVFALALACSRGGPGPAAPDPHGTSAPTVPSPTTPSTPAEPCAWVDQEAIGPTAECPSYVVTDDLYLPRMVVEPGTLVEVAPETSITAAGEVDVRGTSAAPVVFRALDPEAGWNALLILPEGPPGDPATLRGLALSGAGRNGYSAAIYTGGDFYPGGSGGGGQPQPYTLLLDDVTIGDSGSAGIDGGHLLVAETPVRFAGISGPLIEIPGPRSLGTSLATDLGDNADPVIETMFLSPLTVSQEVPIRVLRESGGAAFYAYGDPEFQPVAMVIEPNELRLTAGASLYALGAPLSIDGCTLVADDPAAPWPGILGAESHGLKPALSLTNSTLSGAAARAIDWQVYVPDPVISGTTISGIVADPGEDVCVLTCAGDPQAPELGNTLDCTTPVRCDGV
jgi:hypothetical protein